MERGAPEMDLYRLHGLSGVILTGARRAGQGGTNKALLPYGEEELLQRQVRIMKRSCEEVIVVAPDPKTYLPLVDRDVRIITDRYPGKGPLGGLHAALSLSRFGDLWVVGSGMPSLSPEAAGMMLDWKREHGYDAVIPVIGGRQHPLHGVYGKTCTSPLTAMLASADFRPEMLLASVRTAEMNELMFRERGIPPTFVQTVQTGEERRDAVRL